MSEVYRKKLCYSESSRHYIRILKNYRDKFPTPSEPFFVVINSQRFEVVLGSGYRIWAAKFWKNLPRFREGDTVVFTKNQDASYTLTIEEPLV